VNRAFLKRNDVSNFLAAIHRHRLRRKLTGLSAGSRRAADRLNLEIWSFAYRRFPTSGNAEELACQHMAVSRVPSSYWHSGSNVATMIVLAGLLTACSLGPDYQRPDVAIPPAWSTSDTLNNAPAWPSANWWRSFASPQLDEFEESAKTANYDIAAAVARIRQADAQMRIAGASLLPTLSAGGAISRERTTPTGSSGTGTASTLTASNAALNASYEFDFWGKNASTLAAAKALAQASRFDRETVALTVVSGVATAYFQILALQDRISVAQQNIDAANEVLRALRFEDMFGIATALDVAQQETVVATLTAELPPLEEQLQQTTDALAILVGKLPEDVHVAEGGIDNLSEPVISPGIPASLLARRPDVAEAEAQLIAANADIKVARAAFFPDVQLTAHGGVATAALSSLFGAASPFYAISAAVTQPIFEGGRLEGQLEFSRARYDELMQDYRKSVVSAFSDTEDALAATEFTRLQQQRQQEAVDRARRAYAISTAQLRAGTVNLLTVLNTENSLFPAEDALVQAKLARVEASVSLIRALGGGWQ
jgi:NodT family efflux transporter outer membrane factor (OMF) lipoprotein